MSAHGFNNAEWARWSVAHFLFIAVYVFHMSLHLYLTWIRTTHGTLTIVVLVVLAPAQVSCTVQRLQAGVFKDGGA